MEHQTGAVLESCPMLFTEQGLAMLSGLLNSDIAIKVNINIMRAFVAIRQMITDNSPLKRLSTLEKNFNELKQDLEKIFCRLQRHQRRYTRPNRSNQHNTCRASGKAQEHASKPGRIHKAQRMINAETAACALRSSMNQVHSKSDFNCGSSIGNAKS